MSVNLFIVVTLTRLNDMVNAGLMYEEALKMDKSVNYTNCHHMLRICWADDMSLTAHLV